MKRRIAVSWSSGKDSAWCLHTLRSDPEAEVAGLLTTVTGAFARLEGMGIEPCFPLWGLDTGALARDMEGAGVEAVIVSAPESSPAAALVGTLWSPGAFVGLDDVDPCGEQGEFHTCVVGGVGLPRMDVEIGPVIHRDETVCADVSLRG